MAYIDLSTLEGEDADVYARKSIPMPGQKLSESTFEQIEESLKDAQRYRLKVRNVLADDGIGASKYSKVKVRIGYNALLDALRKDPPKVLVLWEQSRSTRQVKVAAELLDLCEEQGVLLLIRGSLRDPADPDDRFLLTVTAAGDEAEAGRTRLRTKRAMAGTAAKGKDHGQVPFGYRRVYGKHREIIATVQDEEQGPIVKEIVQRVLAGESSRSIANDLTQRQVKRPYGGTTWHRGEIRDMCLKPALRGYREHHGTLTKAVWWDNRLIDEDQAEQLDRIFALRLEQRGGWTTLAKHPLAGIAWCERCERPMYKDKSRSKLSGSDEVRYAYHCQNKGCGRQRDAVHCERFVRDFFDGILSDPRVLRAWAAGAERTNVADLQRRQAELQTELDEAYSLGLSARGIASVEQRVLPQLEELEKEMEAAQGDAALEQVLATAPRTLPEDWDAARALILRLRGRLLCSEAKRGNRFDYDSITVVRAS